MHGMIAKRRDKRGNGIIHWIKTDGACRELCMIRREHSGRREDGSIVDMVEKDGGDLAHAARLRNEAAQKRLSLQDVCEIGGMFRGAEMDGDDV